jgi:putative hemolysin
MKYLLGILFIFSTPLYALEWDCSEYTVFEGRKKHRLCYSKKDDIFFYCKGSCEIKALTAKARKLPFELMPDGGANPASLKCKKVGGRVVLLKDISGDENTFCRAKDESLVSTNAL